MAGWCSEQLSNPGVLQGSDDGSRLRALGPLGTLIQEGRRQLGQVQALHPTPAEAVQSC